MSALFRTACLSIILLSGSHLTLADTITVNSTGTTVDGSDGQCTLHEAAESANNDTASGGAAGECVTGNGVDKIVFNLALPDTIFFTGAGLVFTESVDIEGPGADSLTILSAGLDRIMVFAFISSLQTYNISGLTLDNGTANSDYDGTFSGGGNALVRSSVANFSRVVFRSGGAEANAGQDAGGGMIMHGNSTVRVDSCLFDANQVVTQGNDGGGGAIAVVGGQLTVENSTFVNNRVEMSGSVASSDGDGGAILVAGAADSVYIANSTFSNNEAYGLGGAIHAGGLGASVISVDVTVDHLTVYNNTSDSDSDASNGGGGISNQGNTGTFTISNSIVAGNSDGAGNDNDFDGSSYSSGGYNFVGVAATAFAAGEPNANDDWVGTSGAPLDPLLKALADYGGYTTTHVPESGSTVIDLIPEASCSLSQDQRGALRPRGGNGAGGDGNGCDSGAVERYCPGTVCDDVVFRLELRSRVFLEGPYAGGDTMSTGADYAAARPLSQPYDNPAYNGTVLDYDGAETVSGLPSFAVDWLLVSLRSGTGPETEIPDSEQAVLLRDNGSVLDTSGSRVNWPDLPIDDYHVVIRHRNHADVMSDTLVSFDGGTGRHLFITGNAFSTGSPAQKDLGDGRFGMFAAEGSVDGEITVSDFLPWLSDTRVGVTGYAQTDYDFDGLVTAPDFLLWLTNTRAGAGSQVPD